MTARSADEKVPTKKCRQEGRSPPATRGSHQLGTSKQRARKKQAKAEAEGEAEAEANEGGTSTPEPGGSRGEASKDLRRARAAGAAGQAARVVNPTGRED